MSFTENSQVTFIGPSISAAGFEKVLETSPALAEARQIYEILITYGVDPLYFLAIFTEESGLGTAGYAVQTRSPGNARPPTFIASGVKFETPDKGFFLAYPTWLAGAADYAIRLTTSKYVYLKENRKTIKTIIERASPPSDGNDTAGYIRRVVAFMNSHAEVTKMGLDRALIVAISSGHHNNDGGNPTEYQLTGELTEAYARALRASGADVRVITPDGPDADSDPGDGMFAGGLQAAARKVVEWSNAGWTADLYLETHTEGVADPNVRGVFGIYPNMGTDQNLGNIIASNMKLCRAAALAISSASGLSVRGSGLMGESESGVGIGGDRLGIFLVTTPVAQTTNRIIIEHGSHSSPQDLAILRRPGMLDKIAAAAVQAFNQFYGVTTMPTNDVIESNGKVIGGAFKTRYDALGNLALETAGYPVTNEFDLILNGKKRTVQLFQRCAFIFQDEEAGDWRVVSANFDDLALIAAFARINHLI